MRRIKELREARGMSQQRLAAELNVSQAMVSKYELGQAEPDISIIVHLAEYFGVSTDYLLEVSDIRLNISADNLSETERQVLFDFKRLDSVQKGKLQAYMKGLLQK